MTVTPFAMALEPELEALLRRFDDFINTTQMFEPEKSKRVFRIAATDNPAAILAPDLIPLIASQAPLVKIAFVFPNKSQIAVQTEHGEIDLFVGAGEDAHPDLIGTTLFEEEFVTAQRSQHPRGNKPLTLDEFCSLDHLLISTSGGHFNGMVDEALAELGRERNVSVSVQSYALAPLVLARSDCLCTLPRRFLQRFEDSLDLLTPPLALSKFTMKMFWHPRMRSDPGHKWLREMVQQVAKNAAQ